MKPIFKITLAILFFIVLSGIIVGLTLFNKKHPDTSKSRPDFIITATALQKEFEDNEAVASTRYIKKILEVTGQISSITLNENNHLNISLKSGSDISSVICTFANMSDPSKFKPGEEITLRGECSGFLMDVLLKNCSIIKNRKK
jgi:hypothetical protein